jgi:hypothetical protein
MDKKQMIRNNCISYIYVTQRKCTKGRGGLRFLLQQCYAGINKFFHVQVGCYYCMIALQIEG